MAGLFAAVLAQAGCALSDRWIGQPTHVDASAWNRSAIVRWRAPATTGGARIVHYRLVSDPGQMSVVVPGSQTWGLVAGLKNGVSYGFTVTALGANGTRSTVSAPSNTVTPVPVEIHVRGNQLVNASGQSVRLFGVNRSGTEYRCVVGGGAGIFSGPSDASSIAVMMSWHINAVRVPLNEDCWLGINGLNPAYSGSNYRDAVAQYVRALGDAGLVAILDLHWNAPGGLLSAGQQVMADADHAPAFWTSVATSFKNDPGVIFDLYNEPRDISWNCWRSGCETSDGWRTAGMQSLTDAVRATGATQPIMVAGLNYANDLSGWLSHALRDPIDQLIAGLHVYNTGSSDYCNGVACWDNTLVPVANQVPIVTAELGEFDHGFDFVTRYMTWGSDQWQFDRSVSFLGWSWDASLGEGGPSLITAYDGTPTNFGLGIRTFLEGLFKQGEIAQG